MANFQLIKNNSDKHMEDVTDTRKKTGLLNIIMNNDLLLQSQRPLSAPNNVTATKSLHDDIATGISEDFYPFDHIFKIGPTDSEVTVVRVKQRGLQFKTNENKWNLNHDTIPGDGCHLAESPSLVNLVMVVGQLHNGCEPLTGEYAEYLVPVSSWEPTDHPHIFNEEENNVKVGVSNSTRLTSYRQKRHARKSICSEEEKDNEKIKKLN